MGLADRHLRPRRRQGQHIPASPARVTLLGRFRATDDLGEIRIPAASQRVVALAALHPSPLPRQVVARQLWPHLQLQSALGSLRTALSRLHRAHPSLIVSDADSLTIAEPVSVDACRHEALAHELIAGGPAVPDQLPLEELTTPLLPDWEDDWVALRRERLQELFLHALEAHAVHLARHRRFSPAINTVYAVLGADPLRESAARTLVEVHLAEGNRPHAVRSYLDFRRRLLAALQMEPSDELRGLVASLVNGRDKP